MAFNLFIAYDLLGADRQVEDYERVHEAIQSLGAYHAFQRSVWYVHTQHTPAEAYAIVLPAMRATDRLAVINAESGIVSNWDHPPIDAINAIWFQP